MLRRLPAVRSLILNPMWNSMLRLYRSNVDSLTRLCYMIVMY